MLQALFPPVCPMVPSGNTGHRLAAAFSLCSVTRSGGRLTDLLYAGDSKGTIDTSPEMHLPLRGSVGNNDHTSESRRMSLLSPGRTVVIDLSLQGTLSDLVETPTEPTERSTMRSPADGKQGGSHFVTSLVSREAARILCSEKKWRLGRIISLAVEYLPKLKNKRPLVHPFDHSDPFTWPGAPPAYRFRPWPIDICFVARPIRARAQRRIVSIMGIIDSHSVDHTCSFGRSSCISGRCPGSHIARMTEWSRGGRQHQPDRDREGHSPLLDPLYRNR